MTNVTVRGIIFGRVPKNFFILKIMDKDKPKVKLSFDSCYNYEKLKKEGLVDDDYDKDPDGQIFDDYTDPYGGH